VPQGPLEDHQGTQLVAGSAESREEQSHDYSAGSAADESTDAPSGKEAVTDIDKELPEDQLAFQTDSDAS